MTNQVLHKYNVEEDLIDLAPPQLYPPLSPYFLDIAR
jgi:hypothetical protein